MKYAWLMQALLLGAWSASGVAQAESGYTARLMGPAVTASDLHDPAIWGGAAGASNRPREVAWTPPSQSRSGTLSDYGWTPPKALPARKNSMVERCTDPHMHAWINYYSQQFQVDRSFVYAMIYQESRCNPYAVSPVGARGLMQLMPNSGARDAVKYLTGSDADFDVRLLFDPQTNILLGVAYLRMLLDQFAYVPAGEARHRVALAAYNWGPTRVSKRVPAFPSNKDPSQIARTWTALIPVSETRNYVARVISYHQYLANALAKGTGT